MTKRDALSVVVPLAAIVLVFGLRIAPAGLGQAGAEENSRRPGFDSPRIGVVNVPVVMEGYARGRDMLSKLTAEEKALEERFDRLKRLHADAVAELEVLAEPKPDAKVLAAYGLKLKLQKVQQFEAPALRQQRARSIQQIEDDILREIDAARAALELDIVLSRGLRLQFGPEKGVQLPVVLSHSPEFDLTGEITLRLNAGYRKK